MNRERKLYMVSTLNNQIGFNHSPALYTTALALVIKKFAVSRQADLRSAYYAGTTKDQIIHFEKQKLPGGATSF